MFKKLKNIINKIKTLNITVNNYKNDTIIQSLPSYTYVNRAKKLIKEEKYSLAAEVLIEALSLPQKDPLVYKYLGVICEKTGKHETAIENYQISAELNPHDKQIWQRLGFELLTVKKYENAEKSFENADKIQPGNTDTQTGWGMTLMKQEKFSAALDHFTTAVKINRYNFSAIFLCAVTEIKLEKYDDAEQKLKFLANVFPNESNTYELGRLYSLKNNIDSAIFYAAKSLEFNSLMLPAYILLGKMYALKNDKEKSLEYFTKAEDKDLKKASLYLEWGQVLLKFGDFANAKIKFLKALEEESDDIDVILNLSLSCVLRKDIDEAKQFLEKLSDDNSENKILIQTKAFLSYENNEIEKALQLLRADDEDFLNCYFIAKCYEHLNNHTKVCEYYEACILHNPAFMPVYTDYAKYLISLNNFTEARRKLRKGLKYEESNINLLNLLFFASYNLVKQDICEYNIKEVLKIAEQIEKINPDLFEFSEEKEEMKQLFTEISEREKF